jgi:gliding motility-associated lipoprotein GldH
MKLRNSLLIFALILFVGVSCEKTPTYEKAYAFENNEWKQNVKPAFSVAIKDATKEYDFTITLRTTTGYKYSNLWIYLNTTTPDGEKAREPFEIPITNPDGSWIGKKTGTIVEHSLNFKRRKLPKAGKYMFMLEQGITEAEIDQVLDISLRVEEAEKP